VPAAESENALASKALTEGTRAELKGKEGRVAMIGEMARGRKTF
jgi:hypothetical protein